MTPSDITANVQSGGLTHRQGIAVYSALYGSDPAAPELALPCEECGRVTPLGELVSYKLWCAMPGHRATPGFDEHDQHFCCSQDCAERQVLACLRGHLRPEVERRVATAIATRQVAQGGQAS